MTTPKVVALFVLLAIALIALPVMSATDTSTYMPIVATSGMPRQAQPQAYPGPEPTRSAPAPGLELPGETVEVTGFVSVDSVLIFTFDANHDGENDSIYELPFHGTPPIFGKPYLANVTWPPRAFSNDEWWRVVYFSEELMHHLATPDQSFTSAPVSGIFNSWDEVMKAVNKELGK